MNEEKKPVFLCSAEPPHRLQVVSLFRTAKGIVVRLRDADEPAAERELFVTNREVKRGYENVYKACFVCVNRGQKEKAVALPKSVLERAPGKMAEKAS